MYVPEPSQEFCLPLVAVQESVPVHPDARELKFERFFSGASKSSQVSIASLKKVIAA